jgi:hypothetical protein
MVLLAVEGGEHARMVVGRGACSSAYCLLSGSSGMTGACLDQLSVR